MTFAVLAASVSRRTATACTNIHLRSAAAPSTFQAACFSSTPEPDGNHNHSAYHTVAITGSSGLLGTALIDELSKKNDGMLHGKPMRIVKLIRSDSIKGESFEDEVTNNNNDAVTIASLNWNPHAEGTDSINAEAIKSIDTLVHLAGDNVGEGLLPGPLGMLGIHAWSQEKKDLILSSRVGPTRALSEAIAACPTPTSYLVASGVGVYGNHYMKDEQGHDEQQQSAPDESMDVSNTTGFLADVSRKWEDASRAAITSDVARSTNHRLVNLRLAPILSKFGGALGKLYPIFFLGGGGVVGSGNQYFSYISARDAARSIVHIIERDDVDGPVNLVAPTPATNREFTKALGKVLSRPTIIPLPAFVVKLMFGEMGEEMLLGGVKAAPKKLMESGFEFEHGTIKEALESAVNETI